MRALTFSEFKEDCPAKEDCHHECSMDNSMCRILYRESIAPHLAKQMREEAKKKKNE